MLSGQMSSPVRDSTSNPAENSSETVQTVNLQDETLIPSFIYSANRQVEAAVSHLIKDWEGSHIPDEALHELSKRIQNIISLTFSGSADITPKTSLPVFVQVPDWIIEQLSGDEDGQDNLNYAAESMRDYAQGKPNAEKWEPLYNGVFESFKWIVNASADTLTSRKTGQPLTASGVGSTKSAQKEQPQGVNPNARAITSVALDLTITENDKTTLSEVKLLQMALRKLQYDYTRKLVHYINEGLNEEAAIIAHDLRTADNVSGRLFNALADVTETLNDRMFGLWPETKEVLCAGHADNIRHDFKEYYLDYGDDIERPGV